MNSAESFYASLRTFAQAVNQKLSQTTIGEPEDQLRGPFEVLVNAISQALNYNLICVGETSLPDRLGRPDFAIHLDSALVGYIELKAPGSGANQQHFRGHNREQFKRFAAIPNILYTDGDEWAIYRNGELVGSIVRLNGSITNMGAAAVTQVDAVALLSLFRDYLTWEPLVPTDSKGRVDLRQFASLLAPITGMLRNDVAEALTHTSSPIVQLASDWRQLLFPDASDSQFADSYAQTVAFALLLGRSEGANPLTLVSAKDALATQHSLLSRA
ncbi:MAG: DNA methyltransferase, partial [Armatimonadota bacterium]